MGSLKAVNCREKFVKVAEDESDEAIELPLEEDGTLLLSTLVACFPSSSSLKYRSKATNTVRGVRTVGGRLHAPDDGWASNLFICVFPKENKRKSEDVLENSTPKTKKIEVTKKCSDLIVLNMPWKVTETDIREYFSKFGELVMVQLKKDSKSKQPKGYGFIRFASYDDQMKALNEECHLIGGRRCEVKFPNSKEEPASQLPYKLFVGRITTDLTSEDISEYFQKFGEVLDVFFPQPFRAFCFVTVDNVDVAKKILTRDHIIKGISVSVSSAVPKNENRKSYPTSPYNSNSSKIPPLFDESQFNFSPNCTTSSNGGREGSSYGTQTERYNSNGSWNQRRNGNLDMPNLQNLGINGQGASSNGGGNLFGVGLPLSPALLAAAINQAASWGLVNTSNSSERMQQRGSQRGGPPGSRPYNKRAFNY